MSNVNSVNFCDNCELFFDPRKEFLKHNLSDEQLNRARKKWKMGES